jgi:hypothetical protein
MESRRPGESGTDNDIAISVVLKEIPFFRCFFFVFFFDDILI